MDHSAELRQCPHCRVYNRVRLTKPMLARARCGRCGQPLHLTYYALLGVEPTASERELKQAYRSLVKRWHPDRNPSPDAPATFALLAEAYRTLANPAERRRYDALVISPAAAPPTAGGSGPGPARPRSGNPGPAAAARAATSASAATSAAERGFAAEVGRFAAVSALALTCVALWAGHH
ncbi:MAG: J domain-containing protein, partial [Alicyclobacillus sp.]|nr:J domain-containing protein [Alicyclobacillus sp.]